MSRMLFIRAALCVFVAMPATAGMSMHMSGPIHFTPRLAMSWHNRVGTFFASPRPDMRRLADIGRGLRQQLNLADASVRAALRPMAETIQWEATRLAAIKASEARREDIEQLAALHMFFEPILSEDISSAVHGNWTEVREEASARERRRIEEKISKVARAWKAGGGELSMNADSMAVQMPQPEANGFVKTLNNMGYMTSSLDPYSKDFVAFSRLAPGPALDIGAAYGVASLAALQEGARVIANDIDARHLEILHKRAPIDARDRLALLPGAFPEDLKIKAESIGAALVARVLHFFDGPKIEKAAKALYKWLAPGGKIFIVAETPYLANFSSFIPTYESRKAAGDKWPGWVNDVMAIAPERGKSLPPKMHFLDPEVLSRVFKAAGFRIEKVGTFARTDFPKDLQLDGRESVGMIAVKD